MFHCEKNRNIMNCSFINWNLLDEFFYHETNGGKGYVQLLGLGAKLCCCVNTEWKAPPRHDGQEIGNDELQALECDAY